jgi:protein PhnA
MPEQDLTHRAGSPSAFCGCSGGRNGVDIPPADAVQLCANCRGEKAAPAGHWRCLLGAGWSDVAGVQPAVWRKPGGLDDASVAKARDAMTLSPEVQA